MTGTSISNNTAKLAPGYELPKVPSMNGSSPMNAALNTGLQKQTALNKLNNALAGGKRRKYYGGAQLVPQITPLYSSQNSPGTDGKNGITSKLIGTATQAHANATFDNQVGKGGSRRRVRKTKRFMGSHFGVHQNYGSWPSCYSGGARKKSRKTKSRKTTSTRDKKNTRKSRTTKRR